MQFQPDYSKLASAKLPPEELQVAFSTMLMNAAAIDCGSVVDPDVKRAEFGESLAVSLAMVRSFSLSDVSLYRVLLADCLRFCRMYIAVSDVAEGDFDKYVLKSLMRAIREAYRKGEKEIPNIY